MTDKPTDSFANSLANSLEWGESWFKAQSEAQQQAVDMWMDWLKQLGETTESAVSSGAASMNIPEMPDLRDGADQWWEAVSSSMSGDVQQLFPKMMDAAKNYLDMGEAMWGVMDQLGQSQEDWQSTVNQAMEQLRSTMEAGMPSGGDAWGGFADSWGLDSDSWNRFVSNNSLGGFNPAMNPITMLAGPGAEAYQRMFHTPMPAVGANREWQEKLQHWTHLARDYGKAVNEYSSLLQEANSDAVNILGDTLRKGGMENAPENLRSMYDLWVDSGEAAYAKLALDERFVKAQGEQMNALFRLKKHEQCMADDYLQMLNIPSRRELDSAHKRLQDARREVRCLREKLCESDKLAEDLRAQLKAEFDDSVKRNEAQLAQEMERSEIKMTKLMERTEADATKAMEAADAATKAAADNAKASSDEIAALKAEIARLSKAVESAAKLESKPQAVTKPAAKPTSSGSSAPTSTPKKAAPKKAAPKKVTAKKAAPKQAAPKAAPKTSAAKATASSATAKKAAPKKKAATAPTNRKPRRTTAKTSDTGDKQS
ncbi:MAG: poly(R)-hydroxyalkanoic acid synthase subunit PhaE [Gammaproteobacteria bacterium]